MPLLPVYNQSTLHLLQEIPVPLDPSIIFPSDNGFEFALDEFENCQYFALDVETYAWNFNTNSEIVNGALDPFQNALRLIQVGLPSGKVIICRCEGIEGYSEESNRENVNKFGEVLKKKLWCEDTEVWGQNIKFDLRTIRRHLGFKGRNIICSYLGSQVLWSGIGVEKVQKGKDRSERGIPGFHSLLGICQRLGIEIDKSEQLSFFGSTLTNSQINYAAKDVSVLLEVIPRMRTKITNAGLDYSAKAEWGLIPVFVEMEYLGYPVDEVTLDNLILLYQDKQVELLKPWVETFGDLSPTSVKKTLVPIFKEKLGIEVDDTSAESLAPIKHPAIQALVGAKTLAISLKYLEKIKSCVEISKSSHLEPRVRTQIRQIAGGWRTAASGKISASNRQGKRKTTEAPLAINLQQIPNLTSEHKKAGLKSVRKVFKVPQGYKLIVLDLAASHARIAAQMFRDPMQLAIYNEDRDGHLYMATKILEMEHDSGTEEKRYTFEEVTQIYKSVKGKEKAHIALSEEEIKIQDRRQWGKTGFYSFLNQAGAATMQANFKTEGIDISLEYCNLLKQALRSVYSTLYKGILSSVSKANRHNLSFEAFLDNKKNPVKGRYGIMLGLTGGRSICLKVKSKFKGFDGKPKPDEVAFTDSISFMWLSSEKSMLATATAKVYDFTNLLNEFSPSTDTTPTAWMCDWVHDQIDYVVKDEYVELLAYIAGSAIRESLEEFINIIPVEDKFYHDAKYLRNLWLLDPLKYFTYFCLPTRYNKCIGESMDDLH